MSKFPSDLDDDTTLPFVNDNITEIGGDAINALRDAVFAIEQNIGLGAAGTTNSLAERFGVSINPNGTIKTSAIASMGLVTLPITQDQIADNAQIPESKLRLDHRTQDLFNYIRDLSGDVNLAIGWISTSGVKLEPHLIGAIYRHTLDQIDVSGDPIGFPFLKNKFRQFRDNLQSYNLVNDINNELLAHQWADGSPFGTIRPVFTNNGSVFNSNYAHPASGVFLNTSRFSHIPQTEEDLQLFAEFVDANIINQIQTLQNLNSNGISRASRSSTLGLDGYGQSIVPMTPAIAYLKNTGSNSSPFDDIDKGDDIIEFKPLAGDGYAFDEKFALVRVGDIVRINYGTIEVSFVIKEKKYNQNGSTRKCLVRVVGKNLFYSPIAVARIDRPLFNTNKYGVLAVAPANNNFSQLPSLIVGSPRGAQALGIGFSPDEFNESHYLLYLALYPTGFPQDGYTILPGIDVTGNAGSTPGSYTLDSVVAATNSAFRQAGFNYRFIAFSNQGEFGVMLADSYNNASFSILNAVVTPEGAFDQVATNIFFQNNVVDVFPTSGHSIAPDPCGFGPYGANIASPPFMTTYGSAEASQVPTRLFVPLRKNNYYVDGIELERLNIQVGQAIDGYGDGYWVGKIQTINIFPGPIPAGRVEVTYRVPLDLSTSHLKIGKTLVVQTAGSGGFIDFGRFIISNVSFDCAPAFTDITVYDAVHGQGVSPLTILSDGYVALYFNSDSVSFNAESATDFTSVGPFKRHFEVFIDSNANTNLFQSSNTFTHERGRMGASGINLTVDGSVTLYGSNELSKLDIIRISPKLRGFQFGPVNKINLRINKYDSVTGFYDGYLSSYDGINFSHIGPNTSGKLGEVTRFYDETNIDYIDILFDISTIIASFSSFKFIDIQLFPTLSLDDEVMLIGTCQLDDTTKTVTRVRDERQFGNTSEKDLTTSALNFIALPERLLHFNGVIRGFDIADITEEFITFSGGMALVNGKFQSINNEIFTIPKVVETFFSLDYPINWALCVNSIGELVALPLTDFDPTVGTPNSPNRLFTAKNVVSNTSYVIDSTIFAKLLNNRKDLTILYIVASTVTGTGLSATVSLAIKDVRRYVNDQDSNIPAVVTNDISQGNFKTISSAIAWVKLDNNFQNEIQIKGPSTLIFDPQLTAGNNFIIKGQSNNASLTINSTATMTNVVFSNLTIVFNGAATLNNVSFSDCNITFATTFTSTGGSIDNCTVSVAGIATTANIAATRSTIVFTSAITDTNSRFTNCNLTFTAGGTLTGTLIDPSTVSVGNLITINGGGTITDSTIQVSVPQAFVIGSGFRFERNIVNYTGAPAGGYDATNLVNASFGMMYANVTTSLIDVIIRENTFNTAMIDRLSFISIQLSAYAAVAEDVDISRNKFISTATLEDIRAVISIVSTITAAAGGGAYPKFPRLVNVFIDGNMCNYNQMILVSATRLPSVGYAGAPLACTNTRISNNTCGTIGFINAGGFVSDFNNVGSPNFGLIQNKEDQLDITGNSCKFIASIDHRGDYIPFRSTAYPANGIDWVQTGTGAFLINNNTVNWIQVGTSAYTAPNEGGMIVNNRVSPSNPAYLTAYADSLVSGLTPANVGIILRRGYNGTDPTRSVITGNIIAQKPLVNSSGVSVLYYYDTAMAVFTNANIIGNSVTGVVNTLTNPLSPFSTILYLWGTGNMIVTGNYFDRATLGIQAYITGQVGAGNEVSITGNIFDSQFIDAANTIETVGVNIPSAWKFTGNRNQIFYREIAIVDSTIGMDGNFASGTLNTSLPAGTQGTIGFDPLNTNFFLSTFRQYDFAWTEIADNHYLVVSDFDNTYTNRKGWTKRGSLDPYLPENVKILNAKIGYFESSETGNNILDHTHNYSGSTFQWNVATLTMFKYKDTPTSNDIVNGVLNVRDNVSPSSLDQLGNDVSVADKVIASHYISEAADESNIRANTVVITADLTAHDFVTGKNYRMGWVVDQNFKKAASSETGHYIFFYWSPIVLKCIYL